MLQPDTDRHMGSIEGGLILAPGLISARFERKLGSGMVVLNTLDTLDQATHCRFHHSRAYSSLQLSAVVIVLESDHQQLIGKRHHWGTARIALVPLRHSQQL